MYSYEEVLAGSLKYFNGDELAAKVFVDKYALQNKEGAYLELTPKDMHKRLAKEFARIENKYPNPMSEDEIFNLLDNYKYVCAQGSPMSAIGNPYQIQSLSNCFVIQGVYSDKLDSYGGIMLADQELAQIFKRRGGVGQDISGIRPKGVKTSNAAKTTDGIGVFMERFSNTCREVAMNGRRGAEMITISINHPEIETFIDIKRDLKKVTGANISIKINDDFMIAVKNDKEYTLRWPVDVDTKNAKITKIVKAKNIWQKIMDASWSMAEPGVLYWSNVEKNTPSEIYAEEGHKAISVNPCGEIILPKYDACRLMTMNLLSYVKNPFTKSANFNFEQFKLDVQKAQRLMDDLIDLEIEQVDKIIEKINSDPEDMETKIVELNLWQKIKKMNMSGRRTGLGITALGDCIAALGIKYGSEKSIKTTDLIYKSLAISAYSSSCYLAKERGAFPIFSFNKEKKHNYLNNIFNECEPNVKAMWANTGRRNIALTTTAPTGSVSTQTQTTSGIEPAYLLSYKRRKKINPSDNNAKVDFTDAMGDKWQEFIVHHHGVQQWMDITGEADITKSPYFGATSNDVDWMASVDIQAAAQKWVCHSISKTCNLPKDATKELVSDVYMRAWETGCKGFTVYRDGCRDGVLISAEIESKPKLKTQVGRPQSLQKSEAPKRPDDLFCDIKKVKVQGEQWTIFVGLLNNEPYEVFGGLSKYIDIPNKYKTGKILKNGKIDGNTSYNLSLGTEEDDKMLIKDIANVFDNPTYGSFTRNLSLSLRHGVPIQFVVEQLQKDKYSDITSFSKVMARVLKSYIKDGTQSMAEKICPGCQAKDTLKYQEGCLSCSSCPFSRC